MNNQIEKRNFEILMVEDNLGETILTKVAFMENKIPGHLNIVGDGEEALDYLNRQGKHADAKTPDFILLDLNLPRMDGRTFLRRVKIEGFFKSIPVIVLTNSRLDSDIREVYEMNGNCYIVKPSNLAGYTEIVKKLHDFWMTLVQFPPRLNTLN
ncbi:MAG TPA: response regulator [bacterium]